MAELSSNWKKLQAELKSGTSSSPSSSKRKLKATAPGPAPKKLKVPPLPPKAKKPAPRTAASDKEKGKRAKRPGPCPSSRSMGGVQSTETPHQQGKHGVSPSLALWAADNGISAEAIAEAYDLGTKDPSLVLASAKDKVNHGLTEGLEVGKFVAMDCEMVGVGEGGYKSVLARVSLVDFHGKQIYDSYVKPMEKVTNWRTAVSGITSRNMWFAREFKEVQQVVADILQGRILVGHDLKHDLDVLMLSHPSASIRDTARFVDFKRYGHGRKPALRTLAQEILGVEIQAGAHSSIEDARVAMLLFRKHKSGFDADHANRFASRPVAGGQGKAKGKKKRSG
ncbi:RNA exonuclease 4 [Geosmithia morbida]|uniref:RNA exonuclease 4 n=1 Tax=Geosmithia morbida TaxID=1094350 RepID=A0A9P5D8C3_9HYPO|nr:RNA exonuclease 4 [Geosmithia morbida]KAF4125374.1 RNA exonuclease 4 [Geosmithia morbida]